MKLSTALNIAALCIRRPRVLLSRKRYIFLLSHMRSYSSLLAHLLGSHPQISGHSERLKQYRRKRDLLRMRYFDFQETGESAHAFLLDKILHNRYGVAESVLRSPDVRPAIFIRRPEATYQSIFNMGRNILKDESYCDLDSIHTYYIERLEELVRYSSITSGKAIYFDAETVVDNAGTLLSRFDEWLGLAEPLQTAFTVFDDSGRNLKGDPSGNLQHGEIRKSEMEERIEIPAALLTEALSHYRKCRESLMRNCEAVVL